MRQTQKMCREPKEWICFDTCIAQTKKITSTFKDRAGNLSTEVTYKINVQLTSKDERNTYLAEIYTLKENEYPLHRGGGYVIGIHYKMVPYSYDGHLLNAKTKNQFCDYARGHPILVYETLSGSMDIESDLSRIYSAEVSASYTLGLFPNKTVRCEF